MRHFKEKGSSSYWSYPIVPRSVPDIPRSFLVTATRRATVGWARSSKGDTPKGGTAVNRAPTNDDHLKVTR